MLFWLFVIGVALVIWVVSKPEIRDQQRQEAAEPEEGQLAPEAQLSLERDRIYKNLPLTPDTDEIRLLTIISSEYGCVEYELKVVRLSDRSADSFIPLSYAWGEEKATELIIINGNKFPIRPNLLEALLRLRHCSQGRPYWIDAICIDQNDLVERTAQLRCIRDIYSRARTTYIWLGEQTEASNLAMSWFSALSLNSPGRLQLSKDYEMHPIIWKAFVTDILERPWFSRMWVVQELIMCQNAEVVCGSWHLQWEVLAGVLDIVFEKEMAFSSNAFFNVQPAKQMTTLRRKGIKDYQKRLAMWIGMFGTQKCRDREDSILALLGLAADRDAPALRTLGYTQTYEEICTAATQHILSVPGDLDHICSKSHGSHREAKLPS